MKTTDNQTELFTLVDENDTVIGSITRGEAHADRTKIHRAVNIVITNTQDEILLQKRSATKDLDPGKWTVSVGGHVDFGEEYIEAAIREAKEELGMVILPKDLDLFYHGIIKTDFDTEYRNLYHLSTERLSSEFEFSEEEISQLQYFSQAELKHVMQTDKDFFANEADQVLLLFFNRE